MKPPCEGCLARTIIPNCHNASRCDKWAKYELKKQSDYEDRAKNALSWRPTHSLIIAKRQKLLDRKNK